MTTSNWPACVLNIVGWTGNLSCLRNCEDLRVTVSNWPDSVLNTGERSGNLFCNRKSRGIKSHGFELAELCAKYCMGGLETCFAIEFIRI